MITLFNSNISNANSLSQRDQAVLIAKNALITNTEALHSPYGKNSDQDRNYQFLLAGHKQFHNLWVRDLSMSVSGAMSIGLETTVRDSLEAVFSLQREDGLLPRLIDHMDGQKRAVLGVIGIKNKFKAPLRAWFESENKILTIDGNATAIWAASNYLLKTKDVEFAKQWHDAMEKSLDFLKRNYLEDEIISHQPGFSDWEDSVNRNGRVAYTNVLYVLALRGAASWSSLAGYPEKEKYYLAQAEKQAHLLKNYFWDSKRKILRNFDGDDRWTADANLLAVAENVLNEKDSKEVIMALRSSPLWYPIPGRPTWPNYSKKDKSIFVKAIGLDQYHDQLHWFWLSSLGARAVAKIGDQEECKRILSVMEEQIIRDGVIQEVYRWKESKQHYQGFKNILYRAEKPFTWSSAMYLEAVNNSCT